MNKEGFHIFVCQSFRGDQMSGFCEKQGSMELIAYMDQEVSDRGMDALVSSAGCLKMCEKGPVMVVYPNGDWYGNVKTEEDIDEILDALEEGKRAEKFLIG